MSEINNRKDTDIVDPNGFERVSRMCYLVDLV